MHERLADRRVNHVNLRREFFYATPAEAREHLLQLTGDLLHFEEFPEAVEYHQSKAKRPQPTAPAARSAAEPSQVVGFEQAAGGDEVFRQLVLARIIEPTSKLDSLRVLEEVGIDPPIYRTLTRRLRVFAKDAWRQKIATACAAQARLGPAVRR